MKRDCVAPKRKANISIPVAGERVPRYSYPNPERFGYRTFAKTKDLNP
jgi:hypothetical protein